MTSLASRMPQSDLADLNGHASRDPLADVAGVGMPPAPTTMDELGVDKQVVLNLALKLAYTMPRFSTRWASQRLCLPLQLTGELLENLRHDQLVEVLGHDGPFSFHFAITGSGRERARRLMEVSGYVGPAPISLETYAKALDWQLDHLPVPGPQQVDAALSNLVLTDEAKQVAGLALQARRSLFVYGPPGNGKTALASLLNGAFEGHLWIPHCIAVDENIIKVYDPECHQEVDEELPVDAMGKVDMRWKRIHRPLIIVGGELTIDALDLIYSTSVGYYESSLNFKANGGIFLLDDFGCQRVAPDQLLNRWIHPLETGVDFLTLRTGQQLEVPFRQMLVVSTNLDPDAVMPPAFLRRMGYRLRMEAPSVEQYTTIFGKYAQAVDMQLDDDVLPALLERYKSESRELRACEPRDLIERVRDICRYLDQPPHISTELVDIAWRGYFGNRA